MGTPCLTNTSLIYISANLSTVISSIYAIKYPHFVYLSTTTNIILYSTPVVGSFNLGNFIIKSYNIISYSLVAILTGCSFLYSLYLVSLFL